MIQGLIENFIVASMLILQILIVVYVAGFVVRKKNPESSFVKVLEENGFLLTFLIALASMVGSLYYSIVRGFAPCELCYAIRIVMYPQVVILGIALWKKDGGANMYSLALSFIGLLIAIYQNILPLLPESFVVCSSSAISCTKLYVEYLGYITIPFMALVAFILMILAMSFSHPSLDESSR